MDETTHGVSVLLLPAEFASIEAGDGVQPFKWSMNKENLFWNLAFVPLVKPLIFVLGLE